MLNNDSSSSINVQVLGQALRSLPRDKYILETKVGRVEEHFDFSAKNVTKMLQESLQRLGVSYVDIVHVHDVEFKDLDQVSKPRVG